LPSDPVVITMSVFNSGKTPAIDVTVATHPCSSSKPCGSGLTVKGESPRGMIPPEENGFTVKSAPLYLTSSLSEYKNGKNFIYIESLIGYKDSFGESHWTTVCRYHQYGRPLIEFDLCPKGNDMDTEPYKRYPISASHPAEHSGR
jgi:hypothetical protein